MPLESNSLCNDIINNISIEVLISGYLRAETEWNKVRYTSPHYSKLYFILGGDAYISYRGERHNLLPNRAYLIPSDLIYDNGCETGINFLYFNIRLTNRSGYDFLANYDEMLECEYSCEDIMRLIEKYRSNDLVDSLYVKNKLMEVLLMLISTVPDVKLTNKKYSQCVADALNYIHSHLSAGISIDEICNNVYTARSTLNKKFKNEVGMSLRTYINSEILSRCELLLVDTDLPIVRISERFGFCDQFYFSRCFKEKFGVTPQKYRNGMK
jgi:AraC-like DNA-binding protein